MLRKDAGFLIAAAILVAAFLILTGFRPDTMPFNPGARFSDVVTSHLPAAEFMRESIFAAEEFPVWRETIMAGQPFAANPLNKTAYPIQWMVLFLPPTLHINIMIGLHLLIAGWGMWRWARALGMGVEATVLVALTYMLAPRMIGHLGAGHLDIVYAMAWFPHVMNAARAFANGEKWAILSLALSAALLILADARVSLFAFGVAGIYGLVEVIKRRAWTRLVGLIPSGVTFGGLTAALLVPLFLWSPYLSRTALSRQEAGVFSLEPIHVVAALIPNLRGNIEVLTYVGIITLLLALLAVVTNIRKHWLWATLVFLAAWYALGVNGILWSTLTQIIPPLTWFRVPSRAWLIVGLLVPVLAGFGLDQLLGRLAARLKPIIGMIAIILVAAELALVGRGWLEWRGADDWFDPYLDLGARLVELEADRIYAPAYSLPQNVAQMYYLRLFGGVDPFQISGVSWAIMTAGGAVNDEYSVVMPPLLGVQGDDLSTANRDAQLNADLLGQWQVSHVIAPYTIDADGLTLIDEVDGVNIYANELYQPAETELSPDWVFDSTMPSAEQVTQLNDATMTATVISWATLIGVGIFIVGRGLLRKVSKRLT
jgi:hypothetical protein